MPLRPDDDRVGRDLPEEPLRRVQLVGVTNDDDRSAPVLEHGRLVRLALLVALGCAEHLLRLSVERGRRDRPGADEFMCGARKHAFGWQRRRLDAQVVGGPGDVFAEGHLQARDDLDVDELAIVPDLRAPAHVTQRWAVLELPFGRRRPGTESPVKLLGPRALQLQPNQLPDVVLHWKSIQ